MAKPIQIGTRDSQLAVWQAKFVQSILASLGLESELVFIKSDGELDLVSPLYEMGVQGIFTKTLDIALLDKRIDIAVHSLKDVPTQLPKGLVIAATPARASAADVLVFKSEKVQPESTPNYTLATSSLRRKAQWLHRFPGHRIETLRGNINSRLDKLHQNEHWNGALFAGAGIERIGLEVPNMQALDWMLPAPAQGALGVVCREADTHLREVCAQLNHRDTQLATAAERQFLRHLMGGCSMPIAALAIIEDDMMWLRGNVLSIDGTQKAEVDMAFLAEEGANAGSKAAEQLLKNGGAAILKTFDKQSVKSTEPL
jgi:hydroxymethylbilane synthase